MMKRLQMVFLTRINFFEIYVMIVHFLVAKVNDNVGFYKLAIFVGIEKLLSTRPNVLEDASMRKNNGKNKYKNQTSVFT